MTALEINQEIADNVLLADFMGFTIKNCEEPTWKVWETKIRKYPLTSINGKTAQIFYDNEWHYTGLLEFHKSWDWLMSVVEKINSDTECFVTIWANQCRIHNTYPYKMNDIFVEENSTIEAVFKACVGFVKWRNENTD